MEIIGNTIQIKLKTLERVGLIDIRFEFTISEHSRRHVVGVGGHVVREANGEDRAFVWRQFLIEAESLHQGHELALGFFLSQAFLAHPRVPF